MSSGTRWIELCDSQSADERFACEMMIGGYVNGFEDGFADNDIRNNRFGQLGQPTKPSLCIPDGVTYEDMRLVVVKWLTDYPSIQNLRFLTSVLNALRSRYPCKPVK